MKKRFIAAPQHNEPHAVFKCLNDKQSDAFGAFLDSQGKQDALISDLIIAELHAANKDHHGTTGHESEHRDHGTKGDDHRYNEKEMSLATAIAAGIINYCIMFGFCCAYGIIIFFDPSLKKHRALGINMNLGTAVFMGLLLALGSKIKVAVGGPDMNPVLFIAGFVDKISDYLKSEFHKSVSTSSNRLLGASDEFCIGAHYDTYPSECEEYHEQLRATFICAVTVSSLLLSVVFLTLGGLKLTRYVAYVPTSIIDAFLSCMGYKVFMHGLKLCKYDPTIFVPAAAAGVPLYFLKAYHVGNPALVIPFFLVAPIVLFYVILYASGGNLETARKDDLMFDEIEFEGFWRAWSDGLMNWNAIRWKALLETWVEQLVMIVVCTLDCLVTALRTTETKLPVKIDNHYETQLYGLGNLGAAITGSTAGYMQLKFNVINFGVMCNVSDRRGGIIYGIACASAFLGPILQLNYLPRIFLGTLMFFGASGFVAEHLWGSKEYLSFVEWLQVFLILGVFIWQDILIAVLVGSVLCGITFITKYAKIPCIAGHPMRGGELNSRERHSFLLAMCVHHLMNSWLLVIRLKGYIFFASVQTVTKYLRHMLEEQEAEHIPKYKRLKFVLLDCELLDGLDSSAEKDLQRLARELKERNVRLLWGGLDEQSVYAMSQRGTISSRLDAFADIDSALLYVQGVGLAYRRRQQMSWNRLHPAFELHQSLSHFRDSYDPFRDVLRLDVERFGCPWEYASKVSIRKFKSLLWTPGEWHRELFLVHTGAVGLFPKIPAKDGKGVPQRPVAIYRHGWFLNRQATTRQPTRLYAVALDDGELIYWTNHNWCRMNREQPLMAAAILECVMRQAGSDMERMIKTARNSDSATHSDEKEDAPKRSRRGRHAHLRGMSVLHQLEDDIIFQRPEELDAKLEGIMSAQSLEAFGIFERIPEQEEGFLPDLPRLVRYDLEVAYRTFCVHRENGVGLPWERVNYSLMYAGIFDTLLLCDAFTDELLTEAQFISVGHEAYFMRLSSKQIVKLYNHCARSILDAGMLARDAIIGLLQSELLPNASEQEINGISSTWEDDGSGMISAAEFVGIVSRFARRHEQDWNLLRGIRDIFAQTGAQSDAKELTPEKMVMWAAKSAPFSNLDIEYAEEMLWTAACHSEHVQDGLEGLSLDWTGIAAAVMVDVDQPKGHLPPGPKAADNRKTHHRTFRVSVALAQDVRNFSGADHIAEHRRWLRHKKRTPSADAAEAMSSTQASEKLTPERKGWTALKSGKAKLREAAKNICIVATQEAIEAVGLEVNHTGFSHFIQDLRNVSASNAHPDLFDHTQMPFAYTETDGRSSLKDTFFQWEEEYDNSNRIPNSAEAKLHLLLEDPSSSSAANLWSIFMGFCIVGSVMVLLLKSLINSDEDKMSSSQRMTWRAFECFFNFIFMGEIMVRLAVATALGTQTYFGFLTKPLNICDMVAVTPFFIELALDTSSQGDVAVASMLKVTRLMRLARVARLARLSRKSALFGPISAVFTIIWGIYTREVSM